MNKSNEVPDSAETNCTPLGLSAEELRRIAENLSETPEGILRLVEKERMYREIKRSGIKRKRKAVMSR